MSALVLADEDEERNTQEGTLLPTDASVLKTICAASPGFPDDSSRNPSRNMSYTEGASAEDAPPRPSCSSPPVFQPTRQSPEKVSSSVTPIIIQLSKKRVYSKKVKTAAESSKVTRKPSDAIEKKASMKKVPKVGGNADSLKKKLERKAVTSPLHKKKMGTSSAKNLAVSLKDDSDSSDSDSQSDVEPPLITKKPVVQVAAASQSKAPRKAHTRVKNPAFWSSSSDADEDLKGKEPLKNPVVSSKKGKAIKPNVPAKNVQQQKLVKQIVSSDSSSDSDEKEDLIQSIMSMMSVSTVPSSNPRKRSKKLLTDEAGSSAKLKKGVGKEVKTKKSVRRAAQDNPEELIQSILAMTKASMSAPSISIPDKTKKKADKLGLKKGGVSKKKSPKSKAKEKVESLASTEVVSFEMDMINRILAEKKAAKKKAKLGKTE